MSTQVKNPLDLCLEEGGTRHSWQGTGLDINPLDELVYTARCDWCQETSERPYERGPYHTSVRIRP